MDAKNKQTTAIILGQLFGAAVLVGIFAILGKLDLSVILGSLVGAAVATANFLIMALFANRAADKAQQQDVAGGQKLVQLSYIGRLIGIFGILALCAKSGYFHPLALVLPLAYNRPVLTLAELFQKKGGANHEHEC